MPAGHVNRNVTLEDEVELHDDHTDAICVPIVVEGAIFAWNDLHRSDRSGGGALGVDIASFCDGRRGMLDNERRRAGR
jgi:hypothetical protein